jgi:spore maturation protein SpmB
MTIYLSLLMPFARRKSHGSGFCNNIPVWDLFVAGSCKRGYNRAVRASPVVVAGFCMPPTTKRKPLEVDSAEVAYDVN